MASSIWSFGFGSNMNVEFVRAKKGIHPLESTPAIVKGWKMAMCSRGFPLVEPRYAVAVKEEGAEIHGVALLLSAEGAAEMDRQEGSGRVYDKAEISMTAYDGRKMTGFMYVSRKGPLTEEPCSARYRKVLVDGARDAGLSTAYIEKLATMPAYSPAQETLQKRRALPSPDALPAMTLQDLQGTKGQGEMAHTSILGYVIRVPPSNFGYSAWEGRDFTASRSRVFVGASPDEGDGLGTFPMEAPVAEWTQERLEYLRHWLDYYIGKEGAESVAYLAEFKSQNPDVPL
jgi:hypothetical protein